jgi:hypothetical protein
MVKHVHEKAKANGRKKTPRQRKPDVRDQQEEILREATVYLVRKHGDLLLATNLRENRVHGSRQWIVTVTLRYPTGHEGYVGDLLYDGKEFSFLTPLEVREERMRKIATDPERLRKWNDYRASTLPPAKR